MGEMALNRSPVAPAIRPWPRTIADAGEPPGALLGGSHLRGERAWGRPRSPFGCNSLAMQGEALDADQAAAGGHQPRLIYIRTAIAGVVSPSGPGNEHPATVVEAVDYRMRPMMARVIQIVRDPRDGCR